MGKKKEKKCNCKKAEEASRLLKMANKQNTKKTNKVKLNLLKLGIKIISVIGLIVLFLPILLYVIFFRKK